MLHCVCVLFLLSRAHKAPVYACDWLGVGLSSRTTEWVHGDCPMKTEAMFVVSRWSNGEGIR